MVPTFVVVGGVIEKDGKYLLVQEAGEDIYGKWNIPAGRLDLSEAITEGAKREIREESGLDVELTGICQIGSWKMADKIVASIIFSTKIIGGEIHSDPSEILDARWFTYEEILAMKPELRSPDFLIGAIDTLRNCKIAPMDLIAEATLPQSY